MADTGCGMDTSILEHLFDSFYTTKPAGEGSGLGLSISYDIVCQHGGDIKVETEVGAGSRFTVYLPCTEWNDPLNYAVVGQKKVG